MTWEARLLELYDDLEQQAGGLALQARDADVVDLGRAEYAQVDLASRLHASLGCAVTMGTPSGQVRGRLARVGAGWCLVDTDTQETVVALPAVRSVTGLGPRSDPEQVRPVVARLGLGSVLRALAEETAVLAVWDTEGAALRGVVVRVGADFVELDAPDGGSRMVIPFAAVALVRPR